jgi:hypothetical protein
VGLNRRKIEANALQVRMRNGDLDRKRALCATEVGKRLIVAPGKLLRHRARSAHADAGHRLQESAEALRFRIDFLKKFSPRFNSFCGSPVRSASVRLPQNG